MSRLGFVCACLMVLGTGTVARADGLDQYVGETVILATNFCPVGWAPMNGQLVSPTDTNYNALFNIIGTIYGGDGKSTFALPTAKPMFDANGVTYTQCISLSGTAPPTN